MQSLRDEHITLDHPDVVRDNPPDLSILSAQTQTAVPIPVPAPVPIPVLASVPAPVPAPVPASLPWVCDTRSINMVEGSKHSASSGSRKCEICIRCFDSWEHKKEHIFKYHANLIIACEFCGKGKFQPMMFAHHQWKHAVCSGFTKSFASKELLQKHKPECPFGNKPPQTPMYLTTPSQS